MGVNVTAPVPDVPDAPVVADVLDEAVVVDVLDVPVVAVLDVPVAAVPDVPVAAVPDVAVALDVLDGPDEVDALVSCTPEPVRKPCTRLSRLLLDPASFS